MKVNPRTVKFVLELVVAVASAASVVVPVIHRIANEIIKVF
jgi:hypothetical protein